MADEEDVAVRRERRVARRDRTRSPANRYGDEGGNEEGMADASSRRKNSALNFSASKLVENLKESNETTITRLRRVASTDGMARAAAEARAGRRPISRTLSAQGVRRPERRLRAAEHDVLSHSLGDNLGDPNGNSMMDDSNQMSGSQTDRRRRAPMRTKSSDSGLRAGSQRTPRGGRRRPPQQQERDEAGDDGVMNDNSRRRPPPSRSKSAQDAFPPRGPTRPSRPGRRRPQASGETAEQEEDVIISDSDEEDHHDDNINNNNIDRSSRRQRGGMPPRTRSSDGGLMRGGPRTARPMRRRGSGDNAETSPPKRSSGPGFQRSLTSTPASGGGSGSGPGLMRSHTSTNPRGARSRGGRNTAQEIARVSRERERSPEIDEVFNDIGDPMAAAESVRQISSAHQSNSPVKSRQERRKLREDREREALERRTQQQQQQQQQVQVEKEVAVEPEIKKEEPWMRRLKKTVGDRAPEDSSFNLDGATSTHTEGSKGSSFPKLGDHTAFAADPTFGVFPAVSDMPLATVEGDDDDATASLSITGGGKYSGKLDFSTIS